MTGWDRELMNMLLAKKGKQMKECDSSNESGKETTKSEEIKIHGHKDRSRGGREREEK